MSSQEIVDQTVCIRGCFIWSTKATVDDVKSLVFDEHPHLVLLDVLKLVPPHLEEFHLSIGEGLVSVVKKHLFDSIEHVRNTITLFVVLLWQILTLEHLINRGEPA